VIVTLVTGSVLVFRNQLSLGVLVSFQAMLVALSASVANVTWAMPYFLGAAAGMARIDAILREPVDVQERPGAVDLAPFSSALEVCDVVFAPNGAPVLDGVTLRIAAGSSVGIVGPSGSGKSTLLSLIARFYDPHAGAVRFDGTDLRSATLSSLRRQIGVVFQDNVVVDGTLAENLRLGKENATDAELAAVLGDVSLESLAAGPEGLGVRLGEKGARISGGQRQRLAIARALLRGAPVLLLDEATSALDAETEAAVLATVDRVSVGRTVIAVTHRLATVERADQIFVLDRGRVVEAGAHASLLGAGGLYQRLWDKQHGLRVAADGSGAVVDPAWLRAIPVFADLDDETITTLSRDFQPERFEADRVVVHEGDPGDRFFAVVHGDAEVTRTSPSGESKRVGILHDGDCFGELALLLDQPRAATIRMLSPGHLVSLRRGPFLALVERFPGLRARLAAEAKERVKRNEVRAA
jgi:ATP-binding cassette subfamily B protein